MQFTRVAMSVVVGAALFSACGDAATSGSSTTAVNMNSTSFATLAPTQSTAPLTTNDIQVEGDKTTAATEYEVVAGDVRVNVAKRYGITLEVLDNANLDTAGYLSFNVGLKIKIPAGAVVPGTVSATTTTATEPSTAATTATTLAPTGDCTTGSYVITAEDTSRTKVAEKFDVTVEQLDAANASTSGYSSFYPGLKIIIPCS